MAGSTAPKDESAAPLARLRFQRDVLWNVASLAVLGVSGIALQVLIGRVYDAATLGVFNQVLAAYIFFSQAAVGGINLSALRAVAEHASDRARVSTIVAGTVWPTLALAGFSSLAFFGTREYVAAWLESPAVAEGIAWATPGLFFFALNKVLLSVVNGIRRMRAFAVYQAARYLLILAGLLIAIAIDLPGPRLAFVFSFSEGLLFGVLLVEVLRHMVWPVTSEWVRWSFSHLRYGLKSALSGMLLELNSRVDVLMLGYFLSDTHVGVYSMAAIMAEGFYQLLVVLQNNYNPVLASQISAGRIADLEAMVARGRRTTYLAMAVAGVAIVLVYPLFLEVVAGAPAFRDSLVPFAILIGAMVLTAGYAPFAQTLLMANRPAWHTLLMIGIAAVNIAANWLLIPHFGIRGAALGTATALVASVFLLVGLVRWRVGVRL